MTDALRAKPSACTEVKNATGCISFCFDRRNIFYRLVDFLNAPFEKDACQHQAAGALRNSSNGSAVRRGTQQKIYQVVDFERLPPVKAPTLTLAPFRASRRVRQRRQSIRARICPRKRLSCRSWLERWRVPRQSAGTKPVPSPAPRRRVEAVAARKPHASDSAPLELPPAEVMPTARPQCSCRNLALSFNGASIMGTKKNTARVQTIRTICRGLTRETG